MLERFQDLSEREWSAIIGRLSDDSTYRDGDLDGTIDAREESRELWQKAIESHEEGNIQETLASLMHAKRLAEYWDIGSGPEAAAILWVKVPP